MSQPPWTGPDFSAPPSFDACYRHPDRSTGIRCQRCHKPICGECMNPAAVGFQCPGCIRRGTGRGSWGPNSGPGVRQRAPRTVFGGALTNRNAPMTKIVMGILAGVWVLNLLSRNLFGSLLVMDNSAVEFGHQYWRLFTTGFVSAGLLQVLMNLVVLWLAGQALEQVLGAWRFLALYVLAGAGGATLFFVISGPGGAAVGSSAAVVGLLAANGVVKLRRQEDVRGDIGLLILLIAYSFVISSGSFFWAGQLGGILVGALTGFTLAFAPRRSRTALQVGGLALIAVLCLGVVLAGSLV